MTGKETLLLSSADSTMTNQTLLTSSMSSLTPLNLTMTEPELSSYLDRLQEEHLPLYLPSIIFLVLLAVAGLVGNVLVLILYGGGNKFKVNPTRIFMMAMAGSDLAACTISVPGNIHILFNKWHHESATLCRVVMYSSVCTTLLSAAILVAIAVTRYRLICQPLRWQVSIRQAKVATVCIAIFCVIISTPYYLIYGLARRSTPRPGVYGKSCSIDDVYDKTIFPLFTNGFYLLVYLGASTSMVVLYIMIGVQAYRHKKAQGIRKASTAAFSWKRSEENTTCDMSKTSEQDTSLDRNNGKSDINSSLEESTLQTDSSFDEDQHRSRKLRGEEFRLSVIQSLPEGDPDNSSCPTTNTITAHDVGIKIELGTSSEMDEIDLHDNGSQFASRIEGINVHDDSNTESSNESNTMHSDGRVAWGNRESHQPFSTYRNDTKIQHTAVKLDKAMKYQLGQPILEENATNVENDDKDHFDSPAKNLLSNSRKISSETTVFQGKPRVNYVNEAHPEGSIRFDSVEKNCSSNSNGRGYIETAKSVGRRKSVTIICEHKTHEAQRNKPEENRKKSSSSSTVKPPGKVGKTTLMVSIITSVFIVGYLPFLLITLYLGSLPKHHRPTDSGSTAARLFFQSCVFINNAANPIIYSVFDARFRAEAFRLVTCSKTTGSHR